jgi:glycosyltransferase involved in cell wall biosynthesis
MIKNTKKLAVVIPAYNEQDSIALVVNNILSLEIPDFKIVPLVVNDCSKDETANIASQLECILLDLPVNLGIGGAVQTGYKYAYENDFDYVIQVDGDGQHPAEEIVKLVNEAEKREYNIIIGSRFIEKEGFQSSGMRRFGISFLRNWIKLFSGKTIYDNTSGFRLFDRKVLELVSTTYPDEYPEPESIIMFAKKGFKIKEVPVIMKERQGGESSIRAFNQLYYMIKVSLAIFYTFLRTKR